MNRQICKRAISKIIKTLASRLLLFLIGLLRRFSENTWQNMRVLLEKNETYALGRPEKCVYAPIKREGLESRYQSGFQSNTFSQNTNLLDSSQWAKEIMPFLQNQLSNHTRCAYETDLKQFFLFLEGRINAESLKTLKPEHIILYRKYMEEGRVSGRIMAKSTINRKLAVVKSFLNWLRLNHFLQENPAQLVKGYPQNQESALNGLSDKEAEKILALPDRNKRSGALHCAILHCLLYLGLRKGELIALKMGDLDSERGVDVLKIRGKGHRIRILPLTARVKASIDHYLFACGRNKEDKETPLFTPTKNPRTLTLSKPINPNAITYIVLRYARRAGVLKRISPHSCRATCISNALDRQATHRSVQHLAGWSTPLMIQRYDKRREDLQNSAAFLVDYAARA